MNRFSLPTAADELADCADCGEVANHETLHFDGDAYRCEECHAAHLERQAEKQQEEAE